MELWKIKERLTGDVQRKCNGIVYVQALRSELEFLVRMNKDCYHVIFFYNDNQEKNGNSAEKNSRFLPL